MSKILKLIFIYKTWTLHQKELNLKKKLVFQGNYFWAFQNGLGSTDFFMGPEKIVKPKKLQA